MAISLSLFQMMTSIVYLLQSEGWGAKNKIFVKSHFVGLFSCLASYVKAIEKMGNMDHMLMKWSYLMYDKSWTAKSSLNARCALKESGWKCQNNYGLIGGHVAFILMIIHESNT